MNIDALVGLALVALGVWLVRDSWTRLRATCTAAAIRLLERSATRRPAELDGAMHSVWLHGDWRWLTRKMTTAQREAASDAVDRYSAALNDGKADPVAERWWRR